MPFSTEYEPSGKLSRGEIERACVLQAIGVEGCTVNELTIRLGLGPTLTPAVAEALTPLIQAAHVAWREDRIALTSEGDEWLQVRIQPR